MLLATGVVKDAEVELTAGACCGCAPRLHKSSIEVRAMSGQDANREFSVIEINLDLSRTEVEDLLTGFLSGALCVEIVARLGNLDFLSVACRKRAQLAVASGGAWIAWSTAFKPVAVWGNVDIHRSRQINACLLQIAWCDAPSGHHSLWCYCQTKHPTEWTVGRGQRNDVRRRTHSSTTNDSGP